MRRFTDELWDHMSAIYGKILQHPFVTGLTDGTLPRAPFRHYVLQDAVYLRDYARALAVAGAKASRDDEIAQFCQDAAGAILVERSLHAEFIAGFGLTEQQARDVPALPTTLAYTSYLLRTAHQGSYAEAVSVVLPCYWVYAKVGEQLLERSSPDPLYRRWIDTYGGEEFQSVVARVLETVDRIGVDLSPAERSRCRDHVLTTTRYEWLFWDAAWTGERWPDELNATES